MSLSKQELIAQKRRELEELENDINTNQLSEIADKLREAFPEVQFKIEPSYDEITADLSPTDLSIKFPFNIELCLTVEISDEEYVSATVCSTTTGEDVFDDTDTLENIIQALKDFYVDYSSTTTPVWYENDQEITEEESCSTVQYFYYPFIDKLIKQEQE